MIDWHRIFGMGLTDLFAYTNYIVELEKDLSIKQQFLDVVIIEQVNTGALPHDLPDGLDNLAQHNLLTYKSFRESLTAWSLDELVGHYVNYRKQISEETLLPEEHFRLYAASTHFPESLAKITTLTEIQAGVYETQWGSHTIRILALNRFPETPNNTFWQLYSAIPRKIQVAKLNYHHKLKKMSSLVNQLFEFYTVEGVIMPYTVDDYVKDYVKDHLNVLSPEEVFQKFSTEERLTGLSSEEVFQKFSTEERLTGLSSEEVFQKFSTEERLTGLSTQERLMGLSVEELENYLNKIKKH